MQNHCVTRNYVNDIIKLLFMQFHILEQMEHILEKMENLEIHRFVLFSRYNNERFTSDVLYILHLSF